MPKVWIPPLLRSLSDNRVELDIAGETLREVIDNLDAECPGIKDRVMEGRRMKPGIAVAVDGVVMSKKLGTPLKPESEVHFVPAISGGGSQSPDSGIESCLI